MVSPGEYSEYQLFLIDGDKRDSLSVENQTRTFFALNWMVIHPDRNFDGSREPGKKSGRLNRHYILNREQKLQS